MTWTTPGHGLKALDAMKNIGLWLIWMNLGHELKVVDAMKNSSLLKT